MISNNTSFVASRLSGGADKVAERSKPAETRPDKGTAQVQEPEQEQAVQAKDTEVREPIAKQEAPSKTEEQAMAVKEKTEEAIANVEKFIQDNQRSLNFEMAEKDNRVIVTVLDAETNEIIRQIPPEDMVKISDAINSGQSPALGGLLIDDKA